MTTVLFVLFMKVFPNPNPFCLYFTPEELHLTAYLEQYGQSNKHWRNLPWDIIYHTEPGPDHGHVTDQDS